MTITKLQSEYRKHIADIDQELRSLQMQKRTLNPDWYAEKKRDLNTRHQALVQIVHDLDDVITEARR